MTQTRIEPTDAQILAECDVDTYRASGPGGQNRNKVESAVRLRHRPTGISVIAEESRSQAENRTRALKRLRTALALRIRRPVDDARLGAVRACIDLEGRLRVGRRDARYLPCASALLDVLATHRASVADAARQLSITTGNLSSFLTGDDDVYVEANRLRSEFALKPLRR